MSITNAVLENLPQDPFFIEFYATKNSDNDSFVKWQNSTMSNVV